MSTLIDIAVPDIGDFKNIPVIEILVKAGDQVAKDATLVILESDKATLDVPSPESGTIGELKIAVGDKVSVGSVLLSLQVGSANVISASPTPATPAPTIAPISQPGAKIESMRAERLGHVEQAPSALRRPPHASPSIRRMSREFGIDLSNVIGTGPRGRIVREDLRVFVKGAMSAPDARRGDVVGGIHVAPWPEVDFSNFGRIERAQLSKIRRVSGTNLARNSIVIPHVTNFEDADISDLDVFRTKLNLETGTFHGKITILPFLIKAVAATLAKFATFNSSLDGEELILKQYFHVGFAADTPSGLMVPVIRDVDRKGIREIAAEAAALAAHAREGKLKSGDMQGGCFTISSLGGVGGTGFTPIINAPEVAILGVARAKMQPVWNGEAFVPRLILPMSLSWDHRVVDGVAAARFLVHLSELLADLRRLVL